MAARRALQALADELHPVEQQGQAAEEREQRHGAAAYGDERGPGARVERREMRGVVHREHARRGAPA